VQAVYLILHFLGCQFDNSPLVVKVLQLRLFRNCFDICFVFLFIKTGYVFVSFLLLSIAIIPGYYIRNIYENTQKNY
jgi:hypothetical protein